MSREHDYCLPSMDWPTVVPQTNVSSKNTEEFTKKSFDNPSSSRPKSPTCVWDDLKQQLAVLFSPNVSIVLVNSLRESTRKQYGYYLSEYLKFHEVNCFEFSTHMVIGFLQSLFDRDVGYSALNTARSALSFVSSLLEGKKIGDDPLVCRYLRGVFNMRPSLPRFSSTWDPEIAFKFLDVNSNSLDILELSRKVAFLVAILSGQRISTLADIKFNHVKVSGSQVFISIGMVKQTRPGYSQQPITFQAFPDRPNLCVFNQINEYIKKTDSYRPTNQGFFLTTTKPFRSATKNTISNWIRYILKKCNLQEFTPHSLRGAGTSAAVRNNLLPVDKVLSAAGWSRESTFQKFYAHPLLKQHDSLDVAILKG